MKTLLTLSLAAFALSAGVASAANNFVFNRAASTTASLAFSDVEADIAGTIEVYDQVDGKMDRFIGSARIEAGTTPRLDIALTTEPEGQLLILLSNGNYAMAVLEVQGVIGR